MWAKRARPRPRPSIIADKLISRLRMHLPKGMGANQMATSAASNDDARCDPLALHRLSACSWPYVSVSQCNLGRVVDVMTFAIDLSIHDYI